MRGDGHANICAIDLARQRSRQTSEVLFGVVEMKSGPQPPCPIRGVQSAESGVIEVGVELERHDG